MATPNLALIPSAYKARVVYSVLPNTGAGDFTFIRSGNATRINKDGLIETVDSHVPRLNYDLYQGKPKQCPSLLLEPSSTNLIPFSEDFSQWTKSGLSLVSDATISPNGTLNTDKLVEDTSTALHYCLHTFSVTSGVAYTYSIIAKYNGRLLQLSSSTAFPSSHINYDLQNGTLVVGSGAATGTIEELTNGYYRCTYTDVANSTSAAGLIIPLLSNSLSAPKNISYTGDGSSGIYIWGAQLEQQSYATSYIPTNGSTETRNAEECEDAGNSGTFNDSEGVLMAEISALADDGNIKHISLSDSSTNNRIIIAIDEYNDVRFYYQGTGGSVLVSFSNQSLLNSKILIKYKSTDFSYWINGFEVGVNTSAISFSGLDNISFNNPYQGGSSPFYGNTKQIQYFDSALTDSQLEYLTSYRSFGDMVESQNYIIQ